MDKIRLTSHIKDDDLRVKMYRVVDICNAVLKNYDIRQTEFLNPFEIKNAVAIVNSEPDLSYSIEGGIETAERAVLVIYPYYHQYTDDDANIKYLQIEGNFKFTSVSHRDYLGSFMGLGIKREKIGDILVHENYCQVVVDGDISDYIFYNYNRVGINRVSVKYIDKDGLLPVKEDLEEKTVSVSSLRLDNIISAVYNLSRQESLKYINSEYVFVDYEKITNASRQIPEGALVSVRRKGRFYLSEIGDVSKKGKIRIKIRKYRK